MLRSGLPRADAPDVLSLLRRRRDAIDLLLDLPAGFHTVDVGDVDVVVGPTGLYAVADAGTDVEGAARRVADAATRIRDEVAASVAWAPFVEAVVVVDRVLGRVAEATVVPRRHLRDLVVAGPAQLATRDVDRIVLALS